MRGKEYERVVRYFLTTTGFCRWAKQESGLRWKLDLGMATHVAKMLCYTVAFSGEHYQQKKNDDILLEWMSAEIKRLGTVVPIPYNLQRVKIVKNLMRTFKLIRSKRRPVECKQIQNQMSLFGSGFETANEARMFSRTSSLLDSSQSTSRMLLTA
jgi:hypothetical protein